jgi:MSHA pilin protein MshA
MKKSIKNTAQAGFTLIELIVVIVILGILAATALPKFASMSGDARFASINAAKGSLAATASMAKGKYLITPATTVQVEDITLTYAGTSGYPQADGKLPLAAGLSATDWHVYLNSTATPLAATTNTDGLAISPAIPAYSIAIVPANTVGTPVAGKCYITYGFAADQTTATDATPPVYNVTGSAADCQ